MQRCRLNHPEVKLLSIKTISVYTAVCFHGHTPNVDLTKCTYNNILLLSTKSSLRVFSKNPSIIQPFSIRSESFTKRYLKLALIGRIIYKLSDYYLQSLKEIHRCNKQSITFNVPLNILRRTDTVLRWLYKVCDLFAFSYNETFLECSFPKGKCLGWLFFPFM